MRKRDRTRKRGDQVRNTVKREEREKSRTERREAIVLFSTPFE
jgi:hypothetical protein